MKEFDKFSRSPYFNSSEHTIKLFLEIKKFYPEFDNRNFTKEYLFSKVYGKQTFKEDLYRKLVSNLLKLSKQFMIHLSFQNREVDNSRLLREELINRRLDDLFEAEDKRITQYMKNRPIYHKYFLDFAENNIFLGIHLVNKGDEKRHVSAALDCLKHSALFYFAYTLNITSYLRSRIVVPSYPEADSIWKLSEIILNNEEIYNAVLMVIPEHKELIEIYYSEYRLGINPNPENFFNFKELVFKFFHKFDSHQQNSFIVHLFNFVKYIKDISFNGDKQRLDIQEFKLRNNLTSTGESGIDAGTFIAFLHPYLNLGKFERAEEFIEQYHKKIDAPDRANAYNFAMALLAFHKHDYGKSLNLAAKVAQKKHPFIFRVRVLTILNYVEMEDYESAFYSLDAFKRFIDNNKAMSEEYKRGYINFIKYCRPIVSGFAEGNKKSLENIYWGFEKENSLSVSYYDYLKIKFEKLLK